MLGYCIFPINVVALLNCALKSYQGLFIKFQLTLAGLIWASYCKSRV
jgi:hypothetical protein